MPDNKYDTFSTNSTHGWMMTANTCAPPRPTDGRHLVTQVAHIINPPENPSHFSTTSSAAYAGFDLAAMKRAKLPTTMKDSDKPNQTFPDEIPGFNRYNSSHKDHFPNHRPSRTQLVKLKPNDPSEDDYPMFGIHHPDRAKSLASLTSATYTSNTQLSYTRPPKDGYATVRTVDPFRHTMDFKWIENWKMSDQLSTTRSSYVPMPIGYQRVKSMKHLHSDFRIS